MRCPAVTVFPPPVGAGHEVGGLPALGVRPEVDQDERPVAQAVAPQRAVRCPHVGGQEGPGERQRRRVQGAPAPQPVGGVGHPGGAEAGGVLPAGRADADAERVQPLADAPLQRVEGLPRGRPQGEGHPDAEERLGARGDGLGDLLGAGQVELLGRVGDGAPFEAGLGDGGLHHPLRLQLAHGSPRREPVDVHGQGDVPAQVEQQRRQPAGGDPVGPVPHRQRARPCLLPPGAHDVGVGPVLRPLRSQGVQHRALALLPQPGRPEVLPGRSYRRTDPRPDGPQEGRRPHRGGPSRRRGAGRPGAGARPASGAAGASGPDARPRSGVVGCAPRGRYGRRRTAARPRSRRGASPPRWTASTIRRGPRPAAGH